MMINTPNERPMTGPSFDARELDCFWVHEGCDHAPLTEPEACLNKATTLIYWDGKYEPICQDCRIEAEEFRAELLRSIDEGILRNAI